MLTMDPDSIKRPAVPVRIGVMYRAIQLGILFLTLIAAGLLAMGRSHWFTQPYLAGFFFVLLPLEGAYLLRSLEASRDWREFTPRAGAIVALTAAFL